MEDNESRDGIATDLVPDCFVLAGSWLAFVGLTAFHPVLNTIKIR